METPRKLKLKKQTILNLTTLELGAAHGGTLSSVTTVTTTIGWMPEIQQFTLTVSNPCGKLDALKNWWDHNKQFIAPSAGCRAPSLK
jgi:hypothetical protein